MHLRCLTSGKRCHRSRSVSGIMPAVRNCYRCCCWVYVQSDCLCKLTAHVLETRSLTPASSGPSHPLKELSSRRFQPVTGTKPVLTVSKGMNRLMQQSREISRSSNVLGTRNGATIKLVTSRIDGCPPLRPLLPFPPLPSLLSGWSCHSTEGGVHCIP